MQHARNGAFQIGGVRHSAQRSIFVAICGFLVISSAGGCDNTPPQGKVIGKVGILLPLTGPLAAYGERVKKGVELAIEAVNKDPSQGRFEFKIVDSQADPKTGLAAFNQMTQIEGVSYVVGDVSSSVTLSIVPLLQQQKVLMLSPAASSDKLSNSSPLFFRVWPRNDLEASAVARKSLAGGCKKVATVVVNVDYGVGLGVAFRKVFLEGGGAVALEEAFPLGSQEYRTIWQKVKSVSPECVYFVGHKPEIVAAMGQYAETGLKYKLYGNTNFEDSEILSTVGQTIDGVIFGTATLDTESAEVGVRNFITEFKAKYGNEPTLYSANGYDLVTLSAGLLRKHGKDVAAAAADLKQQGEIKGTSGAFRFLPSGDVLRPIAIKTVQNGQYKTLEFAP